MKQTILLGAHVSIAGGLDQAIMRGEKIGATCIQIFTKSNRQWKSKKITPEEAQSFIATQKESTIVMVVAHASYLINLGSVNAAVLQKSKHAIIDELQRCELLQIPYLVLHPGSYPENEKSEVTLKNIAKIINEAFDEIQPKHTSLLLETMAGQGKAVGKTLDELAIILRSVHNKKHIGICLDTCHLFAAGYNLDTKASYHEFWLTIAKLFHKDAVKVIHVNDSKKELASYVDRHEHIGHGKIKPEFFKLLMNDPHLKNTPKILETPKEHEYHDDIKNIETLKGYIKK